VDPFAVLGVAPDAAPRELSAAYRELAKRWHPDRGGGAEAQRRMAEINAAYDLLRAGELRAGSGPPPPPTGRTARFSDPLRRALGRELLDALDPGEDVRLVCPASTWASPRAILAVTERRLLWLLDDAPTHRIRSLAYGAIAGIEHKVRRPLRRVAVLRVQTRGGRTLSFSELRPATAAAIAGHVGAARMAGLERAS
jgi:hypothetical protein